MAVKELIMRVRAEGAKLAQAQFSALGKELTSSIAKYASLTAAAYATWGFVKSSLNAYMESERVMRKLQLQVGGMAYSLANYAGQLSKTTAEEDDTIISMMSMIAVAVKNESQLKKLSAATIDFAKYMDVDLRTAGEMVMRTIQGTRNAFAMYGVDLSKIKDPQKRVNILITKFGEIAGGYASKSAQTLEGHIKTLENTWQNLKETVGGSIGILIEFFLKGGGSMHDLAVYQAEMAINMAKATAEMPKQASLLEQLKNKMDEIETIRRANMTPYEKWLELKQKDIEKTKQLAEYELIYSDALLENWNIRQKLNLGADKPRTEPGEDSSITRFNASVSKEYQINAKKLLKPMESITVKTFDNMENAVLEYADKVQNVANQITNMWSQAMINQWQAGESFFTNMARGFEQMLASMATSIMSKSVIWGALSLFKGGTALLGGNFGKYLFGAQHGADFRVGGGGGTDSQLVAFRATPGERVTVTPPGQNVSNSSININIEGHIVDSRLIQRELIPALKRAQRLGYQ